MIWRKLDIDKNFIIIKNYSFYGNTCTINKISSKIQFSQCKSFKTMQMAIFLYENYLKETL